MGDVEKREPMAPARAELAVHRAAAAQHANRQTVDGVDVLVGSRIADMGFGVSAGSIDYFA